MKAFGTACMASQRVHNPTLITPSLVGPSQYDETSETSRRSSSLSSRSLRYDDRDAVARRDCVTSTRTADFVRKLAEPDPTVLARVREPDEITTRAKSPGVVGIRGRG
ncbi:hypothetical protein MTY414_62260 [Mycolicibacterium mageritense]|nr:hypothetical protein MTY414_62260 [Mycolicibacterium mageritense]